MRKYRVIFWPLFLSAALVLGILAWRRGTSQQAARALHDLADPNATVANRAWLDLQQLYYTKWAAYELCLDSVNDPRPISFLIERTTRPLPGGGEGLIFAASDRLILYRTDRVYCRTAGEAILAFVYNERKWKVDYAGDWLEWWEKNRGYYGRP